MADRSAAYNEHFMNKMAQNAWDKEKFSMGNMGGVTDESGPIGEGVIASKQATPAQMQQNLLQGGGDASKLGAGLTTAGAATAQPELVAAGLALQTMGQIQAGKQNQRNAQYQAEVAKINARQDAINRMSQIGQSLKA